MTGQELVITAAHAIAGWALCGATMGVGLAVTTVRRAIIVHAAAAPMIFGAISLIYFKYFGFMSPLATAGAFVGIVIAMDFVVVAVLIQRNLDMFRSVLGTWLPFGMIFAVSYAVGRLSRL